tara:strand:+ start:87 stop:632 length:546 start_codon:yes stop_codon:yes gene_type:complete
MVYYGSTISPLSKRLSGHNNDFNRGHYCSSQEILALGDAHIELVENYPCNSKNELDRREGQIQRENKQHCINLSIAGRTPKEYYEDCKNDILAQKKEYYEANKEAKIIKVKEYQKIHRDAISEQKKEYYQTHKDTILASQKEYRESHQDKLKAKRKELYQAKKTTTASPQQLASSPSSPQN